LKNERGFALILTLLITALLVALTAEFVDEVFVDTSARQNFTDGQQASLLAASGITGAIKLLQYAQAMQPGYSSLADLDRLAKLLSIEDEKGTVQVTIEDESGKLNLNSAWGDNGLPIPIYSDFARRLFKNIGLSPDLLDTLADWRDIDDVPHPAGAETVYYKTLKPPYAAKNGKLSTVEELRLVKGFDAVTVERLRPLVTVYDDCNKININTAPVELIAALADDMTGIAKAVVDYRKTNPFKTVNDLGNVPGMRANIVLGLQAFADVKGTAYRIRSAATVNETTRIVEAVVNSGGKILYWREY
jgi:general secretion pathway protein K